MEKPNIIKKSGLPDRSSHIAEKQSWHKKSRFYKVVFPLALVMVVVFGVVFQSAAYSSPSQALTSKCTLTIIDGNVNVTPAGVQNIQSGVDGMTLDIGDVISTSSDASALLTFFDGSTLTLEPDTVIEIEQLKPGDNEQSITVILKQLAGKTWSHVVKLADRSYHYEIKTPSAVAMVRGTQFLTEVDAAGATKVLTSEGLVSVIAHGEEVFLPVGLQTEVQPGMAPSEPVKIDVSKYLEKENKSNKIYASDKKYTSEFTDVNNNSLVNNASKETGLGNGGNNNDTNNSGNQVGASTHSNNGNANSQNNNNNGNANSQSNSNNGNANAQNDGVNVNANGQSNSNNGNANSQNNGVNGNANAQNNGVNVNAVGQDNSAVGQDNSNNNNSNDQDNGNGNPPGLDQGNNGDVINQDNGNNGNANGPDNSSDNSPDPDQGNNGNVSNQDNGNNDNANGPDNSIDSNNENAVGQDDSNNENAVVPDDSNNNNAGGQDNSDNDNAVGQDNGNNDNAGGQDNSSNDNAVGQDNSNGNSPGSGHASNIHDSHKSI